MSQSPEHLATHRLLMEKEAEIARLLVENAELRANLEGQSKAGIDPILVELVEADPAPEKPTTKKRGKSTE